MTSAALETELDRIARERDEAELDLPDMQRKDRLLRVSDLLTPRDRQTVAKAIAAWPAGRGAVIQAKWGRVVAVAAQHPRQLGVIVIPSGGLPAFAAAMDPEAKAPRGAWDRVLKGWEGKRAPLRWLPGDRGPMIRRFHQDGSYRSLVALQVPLLTEALLWLLHARVDSLRRRVGLSDDVTRRMASLAAEAGVIPVSSEPWSIGRAVAWIKHVEGQKKVGDPKVTPPSAAALQAAIAWVRIHEQESFPSPTDKFLWEMRSIARSPIIELTPNQAARLVKLHQQWQPGTSWGSTAPRIIRLPPAHTLR